VARKNVIPSFKMIDAQSMASNITSSTVNVQNMDIASIHVSWSGAAPVGVLTVQARNGAQDPWYDLDFGSPISVSGSPGDHQIVLESLPFTDIQLIYTATSGTGTMTAAITAKQIGG
jgi:hypothetical protein